MLELLQKLLVTMNGSQRERVREYQRRCEDALTEVLLKGTAPPVSLPTFPMQSFGSTRHLITVYNGLDAWQAFCSKHYMLKRMSALSASSKTDAVCGKGHCFLRDTFHDTPISIAEGIGTSGGGEVSP